MIVLKKYTSNLHKSICQYIMPEVMVQYINSFKLNRIEWKVYLDRMI